MLTKVAPIKDEYLARGPRVSTACDSTSPGVRENNVNDATSGMNKAPANNRKSIPTATAIAPATIPPKKYDLGERAIANLLIFLVKYDLRLFPNLKSISKFKTNTNPNKEYIRKLRRKLSRQYGFDNSYILTIRNHI
jgi:hypothetical protein